MKLALLVALLSIPALASAGPITDGCHAAAGASVCTIEYRYTEGCFDWGSTTAVVTAGSAGLFVGGYSANDCDVTSSRGIFAGTYGPGFYEVVAWRTTATAQGSTCSTTAYGSTGPQSLGCPAGDPPNPGWGQLLP